MNSIRLIRYPETLTYDGRQLSPRWAFQKTATSGSVMVFFQGPCDVPTAHLVDLEDRNQGACIRSREMLHIVGELFEWPASAATMLLHLLVGWARDTVAEQTGHVLTRKGSDLYDGNRKFNVGVTTASIGSSLIHVGFNIDATGAPVPAVGLRDWGVDPQAFLEKFMTVVETELRGLDKAATKTLLWPTPSSPV